jgi:hypothetical protein
MCHGYGTNLWESKTSAKAKETARKDDKAKPVKEEKVRDKQLIPAE